MNRTLSAVLLWSIVLLSAAITFAQSRVNVTLPDQNPFKEMLPVNFCEVIQNAHRYDGKTIRVRGILWQHIEGAVLLPYDSDNCEGMRAARDCSENGCEELNNRLRESFSGRSTGRSAMLVVGRFKYRKFLTYGEWRQGLSRYELQISKVEEILKILEKPKQ